MSEHYLLCALSGILIKDLEQVDHGGEMKGGYQLARLHCASSRGCSALAVHDGLCAIGIRRDGSGRILNGAGGPGLNCRGCRDVALWGCLLPGSMRTASGSLTSVLGPASSFASGFLELLGRLIAAWEFVK